MYNNAGGYNQNQFGAPQQQQRGAVNQGGRGGSGFMQNIDMDDPDQLDNLLLDFVNKRNDYNPTAQMPSF